MDQSPSPRRSPPVPLAPSATSFKPRRQNKPSKRRKNRQTFTQQPTSTSKTVAAPTPSASSAPLSHPPLPTSIGSHQSLPSSALTRRKSRWDTLPTDNDHQGQSTKTPTFQSITSSNPSNYTAQTKQSNNYSNNEIGDEDVDRAWYLGNDDNENNNNLMNDEQLIAKRESKRNLTARTLAKIADTTRWETNQLSSGLHNPNHSSNNKSSINIFSDDTSPRVALLVNELTPKFLKQYNNNNSNSSERKIIDIDDHIVWPVKDVTSDMAIIARNGSPTVTKFRENRERGKPRVKYWDLGSHSGAKDMENANQDAERDAKMQSIEKEHHKNDWKDEMKFSSIISNDNKEENNKSKVNNDNQVKDDDGEIEGNENSNKPSIPEVRRSLPVYAVKRKLMNMIREHQVCIVVGETGSGKTTQLAQYLEEEGYTNYGNGIIGCTQPRRVAAVSVAKRVSEEYHSKGCVLGEQVGYSIRFEDNTSNKTVIKFMTDGILMRESLIDTDLDKYSVIIMDEAHERSLNTDILFGILRNIIKKRRDLKVIITSATLNSSKFSTFFGNAPIFNIPGRVFPVDVFYTRNPIEDYVKSAVHQALQLHIQASIPGDILIFMTGQEDIEATCETLAEEINKRNNPPDVLILPIYSQLPTDLQVKIFQPAPKQTRKIIVATNIAETSLTINGIKYVIDCGYCKLKTYNPKLGMDALLLCPTSISSINQRSGRAGRTGPGKCYRLFSSRSFETELLDTNIPEIQRTNLNHIVLLLKTLGIKDILSFNFLDSPPKSNILQSTFSLWLLGALDTNGELTTLGKNMSIFPLDPSLSLLMFIGSQLNCLIETITIVSMLSIPNVFLRPVGREEESDSAREKFFIPESDHLTLLHVYQRWYSSGCRNDWCSRNYINSKSIRKAREVREQLIEIAKSQNMNISNSCEDWDIIREAIGKSFFYQAARRKGIGEYINIRSGVTCGLHPTCAMYGSGLSPDYVVYHELIMTKKEYMSCVTAVEPQWLAEAGPMLYTLKRAGIDNV